ncbi:MAG TPA: hypothetical protein VFZ33_10880 [Chitinophagaceae bacterium]
MRKIALSFFALLFGGYLLAQKYGVDTFAGFIVRAKDTTTGKVILPYKMVKGKKQYEDEEWYQQVTIVDGVGKEKMLLPTEISSYGWSWNDTSQAIFRSFQVVVPRTGSYLMQGQRKPFLQLEIEGPMSLYQYLHREGGERLTAFYRDRYLINEKGEVAVFKIKTFLGTGIAYDLKEVENWFEGYQELSKFNMKDMTTLEILMLINGYNNWKKESH